MNCSSWTLGLGLFVSFWLAASTGAEDLPLHVVAEPDAAQVTVNNVLENDRFWPYRVALSEPAMAIQGTRSVSPGTNGVLVKVDAQKWVRIDFGRDGVVEVPLEKTTLVAESNRVRLGEVEKLAPNLIASLGPRLVESGEGVMRQLDFATIGKREALLLVFADPTEPQFASLAASLAPYQGRPDTLTILVPQGAHPDRQVRQKLRDAKWRVPFVFRHLAPGYTKSHLRDREKVPAIQLTTVEGRALLDQPWSEALPARLEKVLGENAEGTLVSSAPQGPQAPHRPAETGASSGGVGARLEDK